MKRRGEKRKEGKGKVEESRERKKGERREKERRGETNQEENGRFQDSVELQQSKTTHEMAEIKIELGSIRSPSVNMIKQRFRIANLTTDEHQCSLVRLCQTIRIKALITSSPK